MNIVLVDPWTLGCYIRRVMKLALIDQSFHWPPTGGSWVDVRETAIRLKAHGVSPRIFVPCWERWNIPGGRIDSDPGVEVEPIPIRSKQFNFWSLPRILERHIRPWNPDAVMIGNTFYLAPYIIRRFQYLPVYLRMYAHELICLNYMSLNTCNSYNWFEENPTGNICDGNLISTPLKCMFCAWRRMVGTLIGPRLNPVAAEYWSSLAFLPWFSRIMINTLNTLSGIIVYNPFVKNYLKPLRCPVHVVPAGIDCKRFTPSSPDSVSDVSHTTQEDHESEAHTHLPPHSAHSDQASRPVRILLSGRLDDQRKGYHSFREAVKILKMRGLVFEALVTDSRTQDSDEYLKSTGWIPWDHLPELYRSVDVVVCPSIWPEPFGITALEAMASGRPVVASRIGGFQYSVIDGVTGLHFAPGHSEDMADRLEILIRNADLRNRMGQAGRQRVLDHFQWDDIVARYTAPILKGQTPVETDEENWF